MVEIETDKATIDVEAQDDGFLAKIMVSPETAVRQATVSPPAGGEGGICRQAERPTGCR